MAKKKKKYRMMKIALAVVVALALASALSVKLFLGNAARYAVSNTVPKITGTSASLGGASFKILACELELENLVIGNPEDYRTDSALKVGKLTVQIDPASLFTDTVVVRKIIVEGIEVTYEAGMPSNLGRIKANVDAASEKEATGKEAGPEKKAGKSFYIEDVLVTKSSVRISAKGLGGTAVTVPMPDLHMTGIGRKEKGVSFAEAFDEIFTGINSSVLDVVNKSGGIIREGAESIVEKIESLFE